MKPTFLSIVDKQRLADYRLNHDKTTRSDPEIAHYRRVLEPVPLDDLTLPRLPLVQQGARQLVLLGEVAQLPGIVLLFDLTNHAIILGQSNQLNLTPPKSLTDLSSLITLTDSEILLHSPDGGNGTSSASQAAGSSDADKSV